MKPKTTIPAATYPIGVAARLTNIHPETLRVWERRYQIVEPTRASRGRRFYSEQDVHRLTLVKALVDQGHPISAVAALPLDELEERLKANASRTLHRPPRVSAGPCQAIIVGEKLPILLRDQDELELIASYGSAQQCRAPAHGKQADILVWERPALYAETLPEVSRLLVQSRARRALIVHGFGSRRVIADLEAAGVQCVPAGAGLQGILSACRQAQETGLTALQVRLPDGGAIPPRRYTPAQLARLAESSPTMACECPRHLAELINSLAAFEQYSAECESRNLADATLHALLHSITATARSLMETGLERVVQVEGIVVGL